MSCNFLKLSAVVFAIGANAQNSQTVDHSHSEFNSVIKTAESVEILGLNNTESTILWSEDFSNGIPSSWGNAGTSNGNSNSNAVWEYRGPNTTPNTNTGSRGAYTGQTGTIQSTTRTNGFVIFDSDWRDNNGVSGAFGTGIAPAPHRSVLETGNINLSGNQDLLLSFHSYTRYFAGQPKLQFSSDGGTTWGSEIRLHSNVLSNSSNSADDIFSLDVSSHIGNSSQARIRFIYDGTIASGSNYGYYFWMIDDIVIRELPKHALSFTAVPGEPIAIGVRSGQNNGGAVYGFCPEQEARGLEFQANVYNYGISPQTNVHLDVEIKNQTNTVVGQVSSIPVNSLIRGDTLRFSNLRTAVWVPPYKGTFTAVFRVFSDSLNTQTGVILKDSLTFRVTDTVMAAHFGASSNSLGTTNTGNVDGLEIAQRFDLINPEYLKAVRINLGSGTVANAFIEVEVYDTTGFDFLSGFAVSPSAVVSGTLSAADISAGYRYFTFTNPRFLTKGSYYVTIRMFSNNNMNPVSLLNDQTIRQSPMSALFYFPNNSRWYTGYNNSLTLNAPHIEIVLSDNCTQTTIPTFTQTITECEGRSVVVGTNVYTTSGTFTDTILGKAGCDSIVTTNLTITPMDSSYQSVTICRGTSVRIGNDVYSDAGQYFAILKNAQGCASLTVIDVTVDALDTAVYFANDTLFSSATGLTYQWYSCDTDLPIPNETNRGFKPVVNGGYRVEISDGNCTEFSRCVWINNVNVNENVWSNHVLVYPNPAQDYVQIEMGTKINGLRCTVSDLSGRILMVQDLDADSRQTVNIAHLTAGTYLFRLTDEAGQSKTFSIIKK